MLKWLKVFADHELFKQKLCTGLSWTCCSSRYITVYVCVWGCESAYVTSKSTEKPWRLSLYSVMWLVVGQQQHNLRWMPTGCCKHKSCSFDLRTGCNVFASNIKVQWVTCCFSSWMFVDYIHINSWLSKSQKFPSWPVAEVSNNGPQCRLLWRALGLIRYKARTHLCTQN